MFEVITIRFTHAVRWWRHCCMAHSWWYGVSSINSREHCVYYIGNVSLTKFTERAYLYNLFPANDCFCIRSLVSFCWKLCEITVFCRNSVFSRNITR